MAIQRVSRECSALAALVLGMALTAPAVVWAASSVRMAPALSWQGYTGLFNIPHARVTPYGVGTAGYSTQVELAGEYRTGSNYLLSLGLLPNFEINGRIATTDNNRNFFTNPSSEPQIRDLSFNAKFRLPLPEAWPDIALGVQDPAGAAQNFTTEYIVATEQWGPINVTAGVGRSDSKIGRLDGGFGGVEWAAADWLDVLAEYDADAANAGLRVHHATRINGLPLRFDLDLQAATSASDQDGTFTGLSVSIPLGGRTQADTPQEVQQLDSRESHGHARGRASKGAYDTSSDDRNPNSRERDGKASEDSSDSPTKEPAEKDVRTSTSDSARSFEQDVDQSALTTLLGQLQRHGFENISIGHDGEVLYVRAENTVYNRNEVDGLGVLLGEAAEAGEDRFEHIRIILLNADVPVIGVETRTRVWRCYLEQCPDSSTHGTTDDALVRTFDPNDAGDVTWRHTDVNSSTLNPRLILSPSVVTGVATEVGVLDSSLGLRGELRIPLWPGAQAVASAIEPLYETEDFQKGGIFEEAALESGLRDLVLQQALDLGPAMLQASAGRFRFDYLGALAESVLQMGDGRHRLTAKMGRFEHRELEDADERELALASYRHYIPQLDTSVELTGGRFWGQDQGGMIETHHHFADTTISLFYRDTAGEFIGIRATIPLTPRRDMDPRGFQVRGDPRWRYSLRTRVGQDRNTVDFATGDTLRRASGLEQQFFNDDRLNAAYLRRHAPRMRAAWRMAQ